jgi:hypothetical protein
MHQLGFVGGLADPPLPGPAGSPLGEALNAVAACVHAAITWFGLSRADLWPLLGRFGLSRGRPRYVRNRPWVDVDVPNKGLTCDWLPQWSVVRWLSASALSCSVGKQYYRAVSRRECPHERHRRPSLVLRKSAG